MKTDPLNIKYYLLILISYTTGVYLITTLKKENIIYGSIITGSCIISIFLGYILKSNLYKEKKTILIFIIININIFTLGQIFPTPMFLINSAISFYWGSYAYNYQHKNKKQNV